jgi:polyisoprenoid-binding protein YceI
MHKGTRIVAIFAAGLLIAGFALAGNYELDPAHTKILFQVKHLGISTVTGQFTEFSGSFELDPDDLSSLKAKANIKAASVDTANAGRDKHLRSPDFFDAEKYPEIKFVSTKAEQVGEDQLKVHGELTIHGITKPVVLEGKFGGAIKDPWGNQRAAFTATGKINRKDFGLTWSQMLETGGLVVGEEVTIILEVTGVVDAGTE